MIVQAKFITPIFPRPGDLPHDETRVGEVFEATRRGDYYRLTPTYHKSYGDAMTRGGFARRTCNGVENFTEVSP